MPLPHLKIMLDFHCYIRDEWCANYRFKQFCQAEQNKSLGHVPPSIKFPKNPCSVIANFVK